MLKKDNLILIGFMGAGKTSIGAAYAKAYERPLLDTDQLVEAQAEMSVATLFEQKGEAYFRQLETELLKQLLQTATGVVISVGGGLPLKEENQRLLQQLGTVVYLQVQTETVLQRLDQDQTRPLLMGADKAEKVAALLAQRHHYYEQASDYQISVDGKTIPEILAEITLVITKPV